MIQQPSTIFKYMPLRPEFFENFWLRGTRRQDLNDPFEICPTNRVWAHFYSQCGNTRYMNEDAVLEMIQTTGFLDEIDRKLPQFNGSGIISFTSDGNNILMWSHYADEHRGMVVGFDATHEWFHQGSNFDSYTWKLHPVRYSNNRAEDLVNHPVDIFTLKAEAWSYEKEYRLIVDIGDTTKAFQQEVREDRIIEFTHMNYMFMSDLFCMFEIPRDAVVSVTFGIRADHEQTEKIRTRTQSDTKLKHIKYFEARLSAENYSLEVVQMA